MGDDGSPFAVDGVSLSRDLVYLVGFNSFLGDSYDTGLRSDDSSAFTWTQQPTSATGFDYHALSTVWGSGPTDIWMAGELGRLRHWDGLAWRAAAISLDDDLPVQKAIYSIWGAGPDDVWVVGADLALHKRAP
jgi:hypothetical protein